MTHLENFFHCLTLADETDCVYIEICRPRLHVLKAELDNETQLMYQNIIYIVHFFTRKDFRHLGLVLEIDYFCGIFCTEFVNISWKKSVINKTLYNYFIRNDVEGSTLVFCFVGE